MMFDERRLHPIAIVFNMIKSIKDLLFFFLFILVTGDMFAFLIFLGIFLVGNFIYALLAWYRFSYYVEENTLWIEYGIFKRTKRSIAKNRIQSIDFTESIIHRPFKLTKVQIETASGGPKAEAALSAIPLSDAIDLRKVLTDKQGETIPSEQENMPVKTITFHRLLIAGITSGGVGVILGFLGIALTELEDLIPDNIYDVTYEWFVSTSIMMVGLFILLLLTIVWMVSVAWILLRYGKFTVKRTEKELLITRGLLERKQLTIPLSRIQAVGIEENMFRQPLGYLTVFAEVAGGSTDEQLADSTVLFPLLHKTEVADFLEVFVPDYDWQDEEVIWTKPPRSALPLYFIRSSLFVLLAGILIYIIFPNLLWVITGFFFLSLLFGWLAYKDTGFFKSGKRVLLRHRIFKRVTILIHPKRIQAIEKKQHPIERKVKLASMRISIISNRGGKHYHIKNSKEENINDFSASIYKQK